MNKYSVFILLILITSCTSVNRPSLSDFSFLDPGMTYEEVVSRVGEPDRDVGSGVHLFVYDLDDGSELMLSFISLESLQAVYRYVPETDECKWLLGATVVHACTLEMNLKFDQLIVPEECAFFNSGIPSYMYNMLNFEDSPCKLVELSPDGTMLAYVTLETIGFDLDERGVPSFEIVKIVRSGYESAEIYRKTLHVIVSLDWSYDGKLVILDAPIEGGLAWTVIYDPDAGGITQRFRGGISDNSWNHSKTAFYLVMHPVHHGPVCEGYFSGYDFEGRNPLPDINQALDYSGEIYFEPSHFWIEDGKALLLSIRKLTWDYDKSDYILGPAMLIQVNMIGDDPSVEVIHADPTLDYILHNTDDGGYEILESEYEARYCYDF